MGIPKKALPFFEFYGMLYVAASVVRRGKTNRIRNVATG